MKIAFESFVLLATGVLVGFYMGKASVPPPTLPAMVAEEMSRDPAHMVQWITATHDGILLQDQMSWAEVERRFGAGMANMLKPQEACVFPQRSYGENSIYEHWNPKPQKGLCVFTSLDNVRHPDHQGPPLPLVP